MTYDVNNKQQEMAYQLIKDTNVSFFLTGKAGTGKTTFLKKIQEEINKNFIVLAPTGIAAINAGGDTIHSFFGLPFSVITFKEVGKVRSAKIELLRNVDTLIIDEVSMCRADLIDAIDRTLKHICHSGLPFGGKQVVFVGDIYQLPPVVKAEDQEILYDMYGEGIPFSSRLKPSGAKTCRRLSSRRYIVRKMRSSSRPSTVSEMASAYRKILTSSTPECKNAMTNTSLP